uniref:DUF4806 domain-containing protein n=1 Tax=Echinostoma caproni TaxID=27848 RepID=A0A183ASN8_9TREM
LSSTSTSSTNSSHVGRTKRARQTIALPHVADIIMQHRRRVLGSKCHVTLSGLAPSHIPADRCLAGRIVRSLGAVLHFGLRLPPFVSAISSNSKPSNEPVEQPGTVPKEPSDTNSKIPPVLSRYPQPQQNPQIHNIDIVDIIILIDIIENITVAAQSTDHMTRTAVATVTQPKKSTSASVLDQQNEDTSSESPSLSTSDSDVDHVIPSSVQSGCSNPITVSSPSSSKAVPSTTGAAVALIKDADEADFDESGLISEVADVDEIVCNDDENGGVCQLTEGDCTETTDTEDRPPEDTDDPEAELREFLPPPKSLILADNPLLHLPPLATSQMLAEIEDAVMEEETARATSVPAEAELYDPARLLSGLDDSSSSDSPVLQSQCQFRTQSPHRTIRLGSARSHGRSVAHPPSRNHRELADLDQQQCRWQVSACSSSQIHLLSCAIRIPQSCYSLHHLKQGFLRMNLKPNNIIRFQWLTP